MESGCGTISSPGVTAEGPRWQNRALTSQRHVGKGRTWARRRGEARETGGGARGGSGRDGGQGGGGQGDGRRSKGPAPEGDHRSGPPARCPDEVMEKGQGSHTLRIRSGLCRSDFSRVVRVEIRSQE